MRSLIDTTAVLQASYRSTAVEDKPVTRCSRAEAMIDKNRVRQAYGMAGAAKLFTNLETSGRYKRKAAETLVRVRLNRLSHRYLEGDGRDATVRLLARAAAFRHQAATLQKKMGLTFDSASSQMERSRFNSHHDPAKGTRP